MAGDWEWHMMCLMRLRLTVVFFLAIAILYPAEAPNIDITYQKFVLPNGLTLIVHEDHKRPSWR